MGFSKYWIHGHTHNSFNYNIAGTKVICNPRGYSKTFNLSSNTSFNPCLIVDTNDLTENHKKTFKF